MKKKLIPLGVCLIILFVLILTNKETQEFSQTPSLDLATYPVATFSGGCFWCTEADFEKTDGVIEAISGFVGDASDTQPPTYSEVSSGGTTFREAAQVYYNPQVVSYDQLLDVYWRHIDPTDEGGQFTDRGFQYTTTIFYQSEEERIAAEHSRESLMGHEKIDDRIVTAILPFTRFFPAEDYHQDYYKKNPIRYSYYRSGSGRDRFIETTWGDGLLRAQHHDQNRLESRLTPLQYRVTQLDATEPPFNNAYWDNHAEGIYVDIVDGTPLFSSLDKFDSGTGWPSFTKPIDATNVTLHEDTKLLLKRTEVRSTNANSHLGHVFNDAPAELGGVRYCINSAALRFIPKEELVDEYALYLSLFEKNELNN